MATRYNIYYAGQVLEGHAPGDVREKLGKVFKANESTLDKLFSGKAQLLKRDCDRETALKYKQAMERAGAQPIVKSAESEQAAATPATKPTTEGDASAPVSENQTTSSAAERIAALASSEDVRYRQPAGSAPAQPQADKDYDGEVEAVGADILRGHERAPTVEPILPDASLALDEVGARLGTQAPPAPPAPSTDDLDLAEAGELIPNLPGHDEPLSPDTDSIDLAPEGTDLSDCAPPPAQAPDVDLSSIDIAPAGSDVLEDQYRKQEQAAAPATDHINLVD